MGSVSYLESSTDHFLSGMAGVIERECMANGYSPTRLQDGKVVTLVLPGLHSRTRYTMSIGLSETAQKLVLKTTLMIPFSGTRSTWPKGGRISGISRGVILRMGRHRLLFEVSLCTSAETFCRDIKKQLDTMSPKALAITEYLQEKGLLRTYDPDLEASINPIC